jgi:hypothetical protein
MHTCSLTILLETLTLNGIDLRVAPSPQGLGWSPHDSVPIPRWCATDLVRSRTRDSSGLSASCDSRTPFTQARARQAVYSPASTSNPSFWGFTPAVPSRERTICLPPVPTRTASRASYVAGGPPALPGRALAVAQARVLAFLNALRCFEGELDVLCGSTPEWRFSRRRRTSWSINIRPVLLSCDIDAGSHWAGLVKCTSACPSRYWATGGHGRSGLSPLVVLPLRIIQRRSCVCRCMTECDDVRVQPRVFGAGGGQYKLTVSFHKTLSSEQSLPRLESRGGEGSIFSSDR